MELNFTIIIPHYNTPLLLRRLIESIPMRDDLELIIIDDNSDSALVDFDNFPGINRKQVTLIRNHENHGPGYSRNLAIPQAKGKWIIFADADDFFNDGFDAFLSQFADSDADVVYFSANSVNSDTLEPSNRADHIHEFMRLYDIDKKQGELILRYKFSETVCKMVKRELINQHSIVFDSTLIHEDVRFACSVGRYAQKIEVANKDLYCITSRENSVSRRMSKEIYLDELRVFSRWKKFLLEVHPSFELPKFDYRLYNFTRHLYKDNKLFREEYCIIRDAGFSRLFILKNILKYLWKSVGYKLKI